MTAFRGMNTLQPAPLLKSVVGRHRYAHARFIDVPTLSHASGWRGAVVLRDEDRAVKFQRIEFSWRAAFIGLYMTPERDKVWVTILPFFPLYFKRN